MDKWRNQEEPLSQSAKELLEGAIKQFSLFGLKATTRMIAQEADANIAAIPYYFGNKKGLYLASMHYIVDQILESLGPMISADKPAPESAQEAEDEYLRMFEYFFEFFLQRPQSRHWAQFIMREHAAPTEAYEIFYKRYHQLVQKRMVALLGVCLGKPADDESVIIRNHSLFGQGLGFLVAQQSLLRSLSCEVLSGQQKTEVVITVKQNIVAIIRHFRAV